MIYLGNGMYSDAGGYLQHHGIKGQKWGVRNGPPYPINYDPPYSAKEVRKNYGEKVYNRLSKDPIHKWRMDTQIELIHEEPSREELDRIMSNWNRMPKDLQKISDKKSIELFGVDNKTHYKQLLKNWNTESIANGNAIKLKNYNGPAYFVSEKQLKNLVLTPRIPNNYLTNNGYEDNKTARVSFAPSVQKCLAGLSKNLNDKVLYVYMPKNISKYSVYKPNTKAVPDSNITDELWITNPVELKEVSKIRITGNKGKNGKAYKYGNKTAILFDDWTYEKE